MRCTKCSFISFDDLSACAKCASDLSHLSKELNGTCTETRQEFFLGSAIQTPGLDEDNFSDSQMLPPIDQGDMNFDDTSTAGFSPLSSSSAEAMGFGFDDTASVSAEDDVAIELGDIMPIDFDQLDSGSVLAEGTLEHTDSLNLDDFSFDFDKTATVSVPENKEIDLDLTAGFSESGENFQFNDDLSDIDIGDLSQDIPVVLADVSYLSSDKTLTDTSSRFNEDESFDFDQEIFEQLADTSGSLDETISLNADVSLNETQLSFLSSGDEQTAPLELDESLVAELAGPASLDVSGEFSMDFSDDHSASGDFELDAALVAELASGEEVAANSAEDVFSVTESFSTDVVGFESPLEFADSSNVNKDISFTQVEDLTGDFPSVREEDADLFELDLADIDVSDLLDNSDKIPAADADSALNKQRDLFVGQSELGISVDDTVREEAGSRGDEQLDIQVDDDVVLEFDGGLLDEGMDGKDDIKISGSDIVALAEDIDLPEGNTPQDFSSSFLDDTFREGELVDDSFVSSEEDSVEDLLAEDLVLDQTGDNVDYLPSDIDALALDADFEAFLNKTASGDELPEIDLISDDDEGPPDLPV